MGTRNRAPGPLALERLSNALGEPVHYFHGGPRQDATVSTRDSTLDRIETLALIAELRDALATATNRLHDLAGDRG